MALSDIEKVYQEAVDLIGEIEINESSDHDKKPYSTCVRHYAQARDEMIRGYAWNEATEFGLCLEDAIRPKHTYTYRFPLPTDCLRPITTTRPDLKWRVLSGYVYTDYKFGPDSYTIGTDYYAGRYISVSSVTYLINENFTATVWTTDIGHCTTKQEDYGFIEIEYVKEENDPTVWSVDLRQAIILNLATKIVVPITADYERQTKLLEQLHRLVLPHAHAIDAMQGKPKQFFYSEYLDSRE
jgi:hypothetical protein